MCISRIDIDMTLMYPALCYALCYCKLFNEQLYVCDSQLMEFMRTPTGTFGTTPDALGSYDGRAEP